MPFEDYFYLLQYKFLYFFVLHLFTIKKFMEKQKMDKIGSRT